MDLLPSKKNPRRFGAIDFFISGIKISCFNLIPQAAIQVILQDGTEDYLE